MTFSERDLRTDIGRAAYCPNVRALEAAFAREEDLPRTEDAATLAVRLFRETRGVPDDLSVAAFRDAEDAAECLFRALFGDREFVLPAPSRGIFRRLAEKYGARPVEPAPRGRHGAAADCAAAADLAALPLIVSSPNDFGQELTVRETDELAETRWDEPFLIDEAFADFTELSAVPLMEKHKNLISLRSLRFAYSLCGFDMAFVICSREYAERIEAARRTLGVELPSAREYAVAAAELGDTEGFDFRRRAALRWRVRFETSFRDMGFDVIGGRMPYGLAAPKAGMTLGAFADAVLRATGRRVGVLCFPSGKIYMKVPAGTEDEPEAILRELGAWELEFERGTEASSAGSETSGYPPLDPPAPRDAWLRATGQLPVSPEDAAELRRGGSERLLIQTDDGSEPFEVEYRDLERERIYRKQHGEDWDDETFHIHS